MFGCDGSSGPINPLLGCLQSKSVRKLDVNKSSTLVQPFKSYISTPMTSLCSGWQQCQAQLGFSLGRRQGWYQDIRKAVQCQQILSKDIMAVTIFITWSS